MIIRKAILSIFIIGSFVLSGCMQTEDGRDALLDDRGTVVTSDILLYSTLQGEVFILSGVDEEIGTGDSYEILIQVSRSPVFIVGIDAQSTGYALGYFYENTSIQTKGTEIIAECTNRILDLSSLSKYYGGDTNDSGQVITDEGDLFYETMFVANQVRNINDESEVGSPIVLKPYTNYLIRVTNEDVTNIKFSYEIVFDEFSN